MPLGEVTGEVVANVTSVRYSDMGGGQTKAEIDVAGEAKGRAPGRVAGTFTIIRSSTDSARPTERATNPVLDAK